MLRLSSFSYFILILGTLFVPIGCGRAQPSSVQTNELSSQASAPATTPPPVLLPRVNTYTKKIESMAASSTCSTYYWLSRGRSPAGYPQGVSLSFARGVCRFRAQGTSSGLIAIQAAPETGNATKDALTWYKTIFNNLGLATDVAGEEALRAVYTLSLGLGMRESSGEYCAGWDQSAGSNRPSSEAEAGLYQFSYDSIGASTELKKLYAQYQATPQKCWLDVYANGVSCRSQAPLGTGAGANFQVFVKSCPAFATEYAVTLLRLLRGHFGTINRHEAEVRPECDSLLQDVQKLIDADPVNACNELM